MQKRQLSELTGSDHFPEPVWSEGFTYKIECKICKKEMIGDGTLANPWKHKEVGDEKDS